MNQISASIYRIKSHQGISLVQLKVGDNLTLCSIVVDTPKTASYLKEDKPVTILFKETEVTLAKGNLLEISIQNKIPCKIKAIEQGELLSQVILVAEAFELNSIITTNACKQLNLSEGDEVTVLIKTNELSISSND